MSTRRACCAIGSSSSPATTSTGRASIRDAFDAALAGGTNLAFMGSNDGYWNGPVRATATARSSRTSRCYDPNPDRPRQDGDVPRDRQARVHDHGRPAHRAFARCRPAARLRRHPRRRGRSVARRTQGSRRATRSPASSAASTTCSTRTPSRASTRAHRALPLRRAAASTRTATRCASRRRAARACSRRARSSSRGRSTTGAATGRSSPRRRWSRGSGVPVDPRIQQFMRNALDDLTRPAARPGSPCAVAASNCSVASRRPADPHVRSFVAAAPRRRPLGAGLPRPARLHRRPAAARGPATVGAMNVDVWRSASRPPRSRPSRRRQP